MAAKNKITRIKPMFGHNRSHSQHASPRKFRPNIQTKRIFIPEISRFVKVQVTAGELKTIDRIGLDAFLKRQGRSLKEFL